MNPRSLLLWLLVALASLGCAPTWHVVSQSTAEAFRDHPSFALMPVDYSGLREGRLTEGEFLSQKTDQQRRSFAADKVALDERFREGLVAQAREAGVEVLPAVGPGGGLKGRLPAGTPQPEVGGDTKMVLVDAGKFAVRLWATRTEDPQTLADAEAMMETLKATKSKSETLVGGWSVAYESFGWRYDVIASHDVAGEAYHCEGSAESTEDQAAAVAFCKSLVK